MVTESHAFQSNPVDAAVDRGPIGSRTSASARYWMRNVSFATLHRAVWRVARRTEPFAARDLNDVVCADWQRIKRRPPSATTLYRYRTTMVRLGLLARAGKAWKMNVDDPLVRALVDTTPGDDGQPCDEAKVVFANLVVRNLDCRTLFFDLFMGRWRRTLDFGTFCSQSTPVAWRHTRMDKNQQLDLWNSDTGEKRCETEDQAILAVLYGLRNWARDELQMIDEYAELGQNATTWFAICDSGKGGGARSREILRAVRSILAAKTDEEWTTYAVSDLIRVFCIPYRTSRSVLFSALDWLCRHRPASILLVPTPRAVATLASSSAGREHIELARYYRDRRGRLISDIRIHRNTEPPPASP